jgi:hypothetical protein
MHKPYRQNIVLVNEPNAQRVMGRCASPWAFASLRFARRREFTARHATIASTRTPTYRIFIMDAAAGFCYKPARNVNVALLACM